MRRWSFLPGACSGFCCRWRSNPLSKLRASDGTLVGTFPTGPSPVGLAFDRANMWVTNSGNSSVMKR